MARILTPRPESSWYVPDIGDNRANPDPFRVLIRPLTGGEALKREVKIARIAPDKAAKMTNEDWYERAQDGEHGVFCDGVADVYGYVVSDPSGREVKPTAGAELLDAILKHEDAIDGPKLIKDITQAIRSRSHLEGGAKNV